MAGTTIHSSGFVPGQIETAAGEIELNVGRKTIQVSVENIGDRPVQIGSHYHFYEVNDALCSIERLVVAIDSISQQVLQRVLNLGNLAASNSSNTQAASTYTAFRAKSWANWISDRLNNEKANTRIGNGKHFPTGVCRNVWANSGRPHASRGH